MDAVMLCLPKDITYLKEDLYFAMQVTQQKLSK